MGATRRRNNSRDSRDSRDSRAGLRLTVGPCINVHRLQGIVTRGTRTHLIDYLRRGIINRARAQEMLRWIAARESSSSKALEVPDALVGEALTVFALPHLADLDPDAAGELLFELQNHLKGGLATEQLFSYLDRASVS